MCYASDQTRLDAVQRREQEQAFVQADPKDVIAKGKDFPLRFPIYFQFADKISFYWQNELQNGQLPKPAATWERTTNEIVIHDAVDWAKFCKQYHEDLKAAAQPVPEALVQYFGKIDLASTSFSTLPGYQASIANTSGQSTSTKVATSTSAKLTS